MKKLLYSTIWLIVIFLGFNKWVAAQLNAGEIVLNEIVMAAPGIDAQTGCEYVELRGVPNVAAGNYTYIDIEGDVEQNVGTINYLRSLQGITAGANGLIVITGGSNCQQFDAQSTVIADANFQSTFSTKNNGTNTFAVFSGQTNYQRGQDADVNNDGALDQPNLSVFDGIAVRDSNAGANADVHFQPSVLLPRRPGTPAGQAVNAATRFCNENVRNALDSWYYGDLDAVPNSVQYNPSLNTRSVIFPRSGRLTPGAKDAGGHCRIAFHSFRGGTGEIYAVDTDGANQIRLTVNTSEDWDAALSADGAKIAFAGNRNGGEKKFDIYSMNSDGGSQVRLTTDAAYEDSPAFSPDGRKIVFRRIASQQPEIFIMNADGTNQARLTDGGFPSFSPDGAKIVYASVRDGNSEIYSMNADGTNQVRLTNNQGNDSYPSYSPDNQKIIFTSDRETGGNFGIYSMNTDGSNRTRLFADGNYDFRPVRLFGGAKIAFLSDRFNNFNSEVFILRLGENKLINLNRCLKCRRNMFVKNVAWFDLHIAGSHLFDSDTTNLIDTGNRIPAN